MLRYSAKVVLVGLSWIPVAITFTEHVAHIGRIEGISMKPTLNPDSSLGWSDYVFLWKFRLRGTTPVPVSTPSSSPSPSPSPSPSSISSSSSPHTATPNLRVGDVVLLRSPQDPEKVLIKRILATQGDRVLTRAPYPKPTTVIPPNHLWVEGDNTFHSIDSNTFGPVSTGLVIAKATYVVFPPSRFGPISKTAAREARIDELKRNQTEEDL
ncbi:uncharacterized protein SAPINGB_P003577 [Magnusiomyces paraingens]|uniref:Mitochondrial inner membrane protease subunit 2 n=1 Tax=Magnusiomyces paraingens TaxID=2606893 RepID=A0A5E8BXI6_9ASCO|nr:uncharacterized protein SAPINGB_P003577 [Saprochaete ingens]VVT53445.1 unnamed protein product [Saprochaete ingens]